MKKTMPSLLTCVLLDLVGYSSFSIPFLGEFSDLIWAPVSAIIFYRLFGGKIGVFGAVLTFAEELLPFTDFVPGFTLAWLVQQILSPKKKPVPVLVPAKR
jgi:hypothetical protein